MIGAELIMIRSTQCSIAVLRSLGNERDVNILNINMHTRLAALLYAQCCNDIPVEGLLSLLNV